MTTEEVKIPSEIDFSNIRRCPCHDWFCIWSQPDMFYMRFRHERNRISSFFRSERDTTWPHHHPNGTVMAQAGFYYIGISDLVQCFECCLLVGSWYHLGGVHPINVHGDRSRNCRFVLNLPCGNVPINTLESNSNLISRTHNDAIAMYGDVIRANIRLPYSTDVSHSLDNSDSTISGVIDDIKASQYPQYACYGDRLRSFNAWPVTKVQMKDAMSYAGFYYTGKDDNTQCYHCGLVLCDWQPEDHPLLQHIKMFSNCMHIIKVIRKELSTKTARM